MQYPYYINAAPILQNTVQLTALVPSVVQGINSNLIIPYGDYGKDTVYYFQTMNNGLGSIKYTVFDRETTLGLASFMVGYGAATTIAQALFGPMARSQIDLQFPILPKIPNLGRSDPGQVIPG